MLRDQESLSDYNPGNPFHLRHGYQCAETFDVFQLNCSRRRNSILVSRCQDAGVHIVHAGGNRHLIMMDISSPFRLVAIYTPNNKSKRGSVFGRLGQFLTAPCLLVPKGHCMPSSNMKRGRGLGEHSRYSFSRAPQGPVQRRSPKPQDENMGAQLALYQQHLLPG